MDKLFKMIDDVLNAQVQATLLKEIPEGKDKQFMEGLIKLLNEYGIKGFDCISFIQKFALIGKDGDVADENK